MTCPNPPGPDRANRQRDLVPPERLDEVHAVVIGVGAVGRQVGLQLAAMGVPKMTLYDPDTVAVENLAPQGFWETDVGDYKVHAVANVAHQQFPQMDLTAVPDRFRRSDVRTWSGDRRIAVFVCVDSIDARRVIWEAVRDRAAFLADGRVAAEVVRVFASAAPHRNEYSRTLFPAGQAFAGSCTAKSTIYTASVAAGLMLAQFARWLRGQSVTPDQVLNLLAAELTVAGPVPF
jgi:sulfur carrier protein ThiS adenylyltransferase